MNHTLHPECPAESGIHQDIARRARAEGAAAEQDRIADLLMAMPDECNILCALAVVRSQHRTHGKQL